MILGKDLILALNGTPMAAAKSCGLNIQQDFIDVCSPTEARVKRKVPATYDWSMDSDCLMATVAYANQIIDMVTDGTELLAQFYDLQLGLYRTGYAYVSSCKITASTGSLAKMSISLVGSGALNKLSWDNIQYVLYAVTEDIRSTGDNNFDWDSLYGAQDKVYIAIKQNNQYIRWDDGRSTDDLSAPIDDDDYVRTAHFKGGYTDYYIIFGTLSSGNVITPKMVCKITIPLIQQFSNTWFKIEMRVHTPDESQDPTYVYHFYADDIKVSRDEA